MFSAATACLLAGVVEFHGVLSVPGVKGLTGPVLVKV